MQVQRAVILDGAFLSLESYSFLEIYPAVAVAGAVIILCPPVELGCLDLFPQPKFGKGYRNQILIVASRLNKNVSFPVFYNVNSLPQSRTKISSSTPV